MLTHAQSASVPHACSLKMDSFCQAAKPRNTQRSNASAIDCTLSVAVREAVYHKFVLRNHHTQTRNVQTQRKSTVLVQSRNTRPSCDFRVDRTPSRFCVRRCIILNFMLLGSRQLRVFSRILNLCTCIS